MWNRSLSRLSRRRFLQQSSTLTAFGVLGLHPILRQRVRRSEGIRGEHVDGISTFVDPATVRQLAMRAMDVAKGAGTTYADVRLTRTIEQAAGGALGLHFKEAETFGIGVRALVNGAWGFAATSYWTDDEVVRVAQAAVAQAKVNAIGVTQPVELTPRPVATSSWVMPVQEDPLGVPYETKLNIIEGVTDAARQQLPRRSRAGVGVGIPYLLYISSYRQERALATTDGTYVTQTVYRTGGELDLQAGKQSGEIVGSVAATGLETTGRGWEIFAAAHIVDQIPRMLEEVEADAALPVKPIDVGQYDVICDGTTVASLVDATFGHATELDRAMGYEANAGGTSYLGPDLKDWLGTMVASPLINITANRSLAGGIATVQWDDDGVTPTDFSLVTAGQLVDYQTTRDQTPHLQAWYASRQQPVLSHGCAASEDARTVPLSMIPNLAVTPQPSGPTVAAMIAGLEKGIAILGGYASTDFQAKNGMLSKSQAYDVKAGKKVARLVNAGVLFSATDIWKNVTAVGGPASVVHCVQSESKGEPEQTTTHTVSGVALALTKQALIDVTRKA